MWSGLSDSETGNDVERSLKYENGSGYNLITSRVGFIRFLEESKSTLRLRLRI